MRDDLDEMGLHVGALDEGSEMPALICRRLNKEAEDIFVDHDQLVARASYKPSRANPMAAAMHSDAVQAVDHPKPETPIVQWLKQQKAKGTFVRIDDVLERLDG